MGIGIENLQGECLKGWISNKLPENRCDGPSRESETYEFRRLLNRASAPVRACVQMRTIRSWQSESVVDNRWIISSSFRPEVMIQRLIDDLKVHTSFTVCSPVSQPPAQVCHRLDDCWNHVCTFWEDWGCTRKVDDEFKST